MLEIHAGQSEAVAWQLPGRKDEKEAQETNPLEDQIDS